MCSISGDVMIEENLTKNYRIDKCKKCLVAVPSVILRKTDAYCKSCFLPATIHKFRATLGKYRIIRPNDRVLVLYQTGHPSTALLHLIRSGLELATHKKLRLEPVILFIDEHQKVTLDERIKMYKIISAEFTSHNFSGYITSLHSFMNNVNDVPKYVGINNNLNINSIQNLGDETNKKFSNRTLYDDSLNICRRQLILKMAIELNCKTVFTPDISSDVAINMLSNLSLGRGSHLSLDVGILDDREPDIKILQPLRYFDMKELAFYNVFNNLHPSISKNPDSSLTSSLNGLISKFVRDLQENFPSTIKTVVRTGDKLTCDKTENICVLCKAPIEIQQQLSSSEARDFSHWVSTHNSNKNIVEYNSQTNNNILCYGCKNISNELQI